MPRHPRHGKGMLDDARNAYNRAKDAYNSPLGQAAAKAARGYFNFGGVHLGAPTAGQLQYANQHVGGRRRRGGVGLDDGIGLAGQAIGMIPGAAEALGPFGELLGIHAPPPPPPRASFHGTQGYVGPQVHARQGVMGRGMVPHQCPHCGGAHHARATTVKHKCKMCGGSWASAFRSVASAVKKVASNPMVQHLAQAAAPHLLAAAQHYAPGLTSAVQRYIPQAQAMAQNPMVAAALAAARQRAGMGKPRRAPTAHALAVKRVMAEHGMSLGGASKYVAHHGLARHY